MKLKNPGSQAGLLGVGLVTATAGYFFLLRPYLEKREFLALESEAKMLYEGRRAGSEEAGKRTGRLNPKAESAP